MQPAMHPMAKGKVNKRAKRRSHFGKLLVLFAILAVAIVFLVIAIYRHRSNQNFAKDKPIAIVDAGHGAFTSLGIIDVGASHFGLKEADLVLDIAFRTQKKLEGLGWIAITTRDGDWTPFSLADRATFANALQADVFLSLHLNSHTSRSAHGLIVFYWRPEDKPLAELLQKRLSEKLGLRDRGTETAPFTVLVWSPLPAVLVELGFLSNRREAKRLANPQFRDKAASVLAEALNEWILKKRAKERER
ncbi:MAG: N-acetylmuramoyl-L-alanine amidase [Armatimonadetes bacterium]|nr:N-acetylmuramoyl-L-alanine amidase [Armatimonadota bacterium]MDW8030009.1 N-acetylmuramoyl-L-alanine amidase [Armatimonadota bacterium]